MVTSAVIKNPRSIMEEIFKMAGSGDPEFAQHLTEFEAKAGVNVLDDIGAPLGGEVTGPFFDRALLFDVSKYGFRKSERCPSKLLTRTALDH